MPSLIDLRRRIRAVKSTQQITKAMKMIAASRLRKSQERVVNARPFAIEAMRMLRDLAARTDASSHPLLAVREEKTVLAFVLTADKGLCGSFNTNIIKAAGQAILARSNQMVMLGLIGRKGRDFFRRRGYPVAYERVNVFQHLKFEDAEDIANVAIEEYAAAKVDAVYLIYNEFKSVIQQRIVAEKLLPIPRADLNEVDAAARMDYIYEPDPATLFDRILPGHVRVQVWHALLESAAAENAARMTAMDAATKNATDMIDGLTLYMNKVRQAGITREIIEVVSGAQAL
ncbi:MAG: ATP synthase F1 subunit gamma [Vicinamibacterales bacterium]|jgi:F-type H+-transporting ATPase subunit gamma|nr:ATP synthase F1 subunit gamma [Vicinamibacterales bacterium]